MLLIIKWYAKRLCSVIHNSNKIERLEIMLNLNNESGGDIPQNVPYQSSGDIPQTAPYQPGQYIPPQGPTPPVRSHTGRTVVLTMLLALLFGVVVFAAGWQFGKASSPSSTASVPPLQTGVNAQATVPALTGNNIEAVREAVISKVQPAVVQVNVQLPNGSAIGSGVIIDKRG